MVITVIDIMRLDRTQDRSQFICVSATLSVAYNTWHSLSNGMVERKNRTLQDIVWCVLASFLIMTIMPNLHLFLVYDVVKLRLRFIIHILRSWIRIIFNGYFIGSCKKSMGSKFYCLSHTIGDS